MENILADFQRILFSVAGHGVNANRKSRHLYDLYQMMDKDLAKAAVKDDELFIKIPIGKL